MKAIAMVMNTQDPYGHRLMLRAAEENENEEVRLISF